MKAVQITPHKKLSSREVLKLSRRKIGNSTRLPLYSLMTYVYFINNNKIIVCVASVKLAGLVRNALLAINAMKQINNQNQIWKDTWCHDTDQVYVATIHKIAIFSCTDAAEEAYQLHTQEQS